MSGLQNVQTQVLYSRMTTACDQATEYGRLINELWRIKGNDTEWDDVQNTSDGSTLLMYMVRVSRLNLASAIVMMSSVVDKTDRDGNTSLIHAVSANNMGAAVLLLTQNANIHARNHAGDYALSYAI